MGYTERAGTEARTRRGWRRVWPALLVAASVLAVLGCGNIRTGDAEVYGVAKFKMPAFPETGANKVQIFTEMHYQPSYKSQEGPRLLPPPDSVPVTGREVFYSSLEEHRELTAPERFVRSYDGGRAQELFRVNCMVCHGPTMRGDAEENPARQALILSFMDKGPFPADLMGDVSQDSADGELFAFISNGGRQGYAAMERGRRSSSPMPEFRYLLTEEERWTLVLYLRGMQELVR